MPPVMLTQSSAASRCGRARAGRKTCSEATKIPALIEFRDSAQPNFVFYLNGEMVTKIAGADIVKIKETIFEKAPKLR